jgi:hypothetical protein
VTGASWWSRRQRRRRRRRKQDLEVFSDLTELGIRSAKDTIHVPKYMYNIFLEMRQKILPDFY